MVLGFLIILDSTLFACHERSDSVDMGINRVITGCQMLQLEAKPDLIVLDVFKKPGIPYYYYVRYMNIGAPAQGDFLIRLSSENGTFPGNHLYRFPVPEPCSIRETGGYTVGLLNVAQTQPATIRVDIDWEQRVDETSEVNNTLIKLVATQ